MPATPPTAARGIRRTKRCASGASAARCEHELKTIKFARRSNGRDVRQPIVHIFIRRFGTRCIMTSTRWSSMTWNDPYPDRRGFPHQRHGNASDEDGAGHVPGRSERACGEVNESFDGELGRTAED